MNSYKLAYYQRQNKTLYLYSKYLVEEKSFALENQNSIKRIENLLASKRVLDFTRFQESGSTFLGKYKENLTVDLNQRLFHNKKFFVPGKSIKLRSVNSEKFRFNKLVKIYQYFINKFLVNDILFYKELLTYFLFLRKLSLKFNGLNSVIEVKDEKKYLFNLLNKVDTVKKIILSSIEKHKFMFNVKESFSVEHSDHLWSYTKEKLKRLKFHKNYLNIIRKYNHRKLVNTLASKYQGYIDKKKFLDDQIKNFTSYYKINYNFQEDYRPLEAVSYFHLENPGAVIKDIYPFWLKKKNLYGLSGIGYSVSRLHKPLTLSKLLGFFDKSNAQFGYLYKNNVLSNPEKFVFYSNNLISDVNSRFLRNLVRNQVFEIRYNSLLNEFNGGLDFNSVMPVINPKILLLTVKNKLRISKKKIIFNSNLDNFSAQKNLNLKYPTYKEWKQLLKKKVHYSYRWPAFSSIFFQNKLGINYFLYNASIVQKDFDNTLLNYLKFRKSEIEIKLADSTLETE